MAVYGVNRTLKNAGDVNTIEPEILGGRVKWLYDTYTFAASAAGTIVHLFGQDLPAEARIVDWVIDHDNIQNNTTLIFGTLADDNEFMDAVDCGAAAAKKTYAVNGVAGSLGFEIAAGDGQTLMLTTAVGAATGTVRVGVAYVTKGN